MSVLREQFTIDESDSAPVIPADGRWLRLINEQGVAVNAAELVDRLGRLPRSSAVDRLDIEYKSQLDNVHICAAFPNLRFMSVCGFRIRTLDGLEHFRGSGILVDTWKNKKRRLEQLAVCSINRIEIHNTQPHDIRAIGNCHSIGSIVLAQAQSVDFALWRDLPLEFLSLNTCPIQVVEDTAQVPSLRTLWVINGRRFVRFAGDCSNVRYAKLDATKFTEIASIQALSNVEELEIRKASGPLSVVLPLRRLRRVDFDISPMEVDVLRLKDSLPDLERLYLSNTDEELVRRVSEHNPGLLVTNSEFDAFRDGVRVGPAPRKRRAKTT